MAACDVTRLAVIGYGRIAPRHMEVLRALGCEFVAACNRSQAGRSKARTEGGIPHTYTSIAEMLERERPDGVVCSVSFDQVYAAAQEIIPFQFPTLLEKPPGTSVAETIELQRLASRHGTPVMVGLNRRHYSVLQRAVEDAGGLEAITAVFVEWSEAPEGFLDRGFTPEQVSRMVYGNSLHGLDLLAYLAGAMPEAKFIGRNLGEPFRWLMALQGVSERGVLGSFHSTWDSPGGWRLTFCSRARRYTFAPLESCQVLERGGGEPRSIEPDETDQRFKPGFYGQARAFIEMMATGEVPQRTSLASALPAIALAEGLTQACSPTARRL
jgi:predicted dehydrogenase